MSRTGTTSTTAGQRPRSREPQSRTHGGGAQVGRHQVRRWLLTLALICGAAGCGGGGGGGDSGGGGTVVAPSRSDFETTEYHANYGLGAIRASSAYAAGATGRGVKIALVDTGVDADHPELKSRIDPASTDIVTNDPQFLDDINGHGTAVAGVIAARRNQALTHGVAFDARLLAVRADAPGTCATACGFFQSDVAAATDYAVDQGAAVINYSLGGADSLGTTLTDAFERAVDAGAILVLAAGNDAADQPSYPGRFAADPGADDQAIVVGAVNANREIASFSNRAGRAVDHYLVAPGVDVLAPAIGGGAALVSGTSFAAPHVSGAAALVLQAAPFLGAAEVVELLLESATDLGDRGADPVYGRGLLNLRAALAPQGSLSVPLGATVGSASVALDGTGLRLGPAFGQGPDLGAAIFLDGYGRPYWLELGDRIAAPAAGPYLHAWLAPADPGPTLSLAFGPAVALDLAIGGPAERAVAEPPADPAGPAFALDLGMGDLAGGSAGMALSHGFSLQNRFGLSSVDPAAAGGLISQDGLASPYLALADHGDGLVLARTLGQGLALRLGVAVRETDRVEPFDQGRNAIVIGELVHSFDANHALSLQLGGLDEQQSLLDTQGGGALGTPEGARTTFVGLAGRWAFADRWALFGRGSLGSTDPGTPAGGLLEEISTLWSTSYAAGLAGRDLLAAGDQLTVAILQPLRVEAGSAVLDRPVGRSFDGRIRRQADAIDLAPEGRELDLDLGYRLAFGGRWLLGLNWLTRLEPGHQGAAQPEHAVAIRLRTAL